MRFQSRPGFLVHRAFHRGLIRIQVWRNNRSVAEAFRDADACDVIYRRRSAAPARILKGFIVVFLVSSIALVWHHKRTGNWDMRMGADDMKSPLSEILPAPVASRHMTGPPAPSANPSRTPQVALGSLAPAPALMSTPALPPPPAATAEPSGPAHFPSQANVLHNVKGRQRLN